MPSAHDLAMRLRAAYLALHRRTNAALARSGLTADQFVLLTALSEGDGVTQKTLGERTASDPNTLSEMLARLEAKGLVSRRRHAADGRARCVTLTRRGRRVQATLWEGSAAIRAELESLFPSDVLDGLVDSLGQVALAMGPPVDQQGRLPPRSARGTGAGRPKAGQS